MIIENYDAQKVSLRLTKDEAYMLFIATDGPFFDETLNRDIPVLPDWTEQEALMFEKRIEFFYKNLNRENGILALSNKELFYLIKIHADTMKELDPVEYPTIVGIDFSDAETFLNALRQAASLLAGVSQEEAPKNPTGKTERDNLTLHGHERLQQRGISEKEVRDAIEEANRTGRVTIKMGKYGTPQTLYETEDGLTVVVETSGRNTGKVITAWRKQP